MALVPAGGGGDHEIARMVNFHAALQQKTAGVPGNVSAMFVQPVFMKPLTPSDGNSCWRRTLPLISRIRLPIVFKAKFG
jgi:hypothetical protein